MSSKQPTKIGCRQPPRFLSYKERVEAGIQEPYKFDLVKSFTPPHVIAEIMEEERFIKTHGYNLVSHTFYDDDGNSYQEYVTQRWLDARNALRGLMIENPPPYDELFEHQDEPPPRKEDLEEMELKTV